MKLRHYAFFLRRNLRRRRGRTATAILAIAFGIGIFHLMAALSLALHSQVLDQIESIFPERSLLVRRRAVDLGPIAVSPKLLVPRLTPETAKRISDLPEVEAVHPILPLKVPVMAMGQLMGFEGQTEAVVYGVPPALVADEVTGERGFTYAAGQTVPVMVPRYFIDMFNLGMAESQNLPKLTDSFVVGRGFDLLLGASLLTIERDDIDTSTLTNVRCEIVGMTRDPSLFALLLPIEYVRIFNRMYWGDKYEEVYVQMNVLVRSSRDYEKVIKTIETMGFDVSGRRETAQRLRFAVTGGVVILLLFGLAVLTMAVINIMNTFALIMIERRDEIGLLRAVGATRRAATTMLLGESFVVGLLGGLAGSGAAWAVLILLNGALLRWVPQFSLTPDYWLDTRAGIFVFCVVLGALGSAVATAPLVRRSVRRWPAELLRDT